MNTKNILILGSTGKGKSTLINVMKGEEVAKEGNYSTSTTSEIQAVEVNHNGNNYKIIDTVGFGDTNIEPIEVLRKLANIGEEIKGGVNQIFFVFDGKMTEEQVVLYLFLRKILFNGEAYKHTTLIRTHFANFESNFECAKDHNELLSNIRIRQSKEPSEWGKELINLLLFGNSIIYVDNPPLLAHYKEISKEIRDKSRIKLFNHLENNCNETYEVDLENFKKQIDNYKNEVGELNREIKRLIKENKIIKLNLELGESQKKQELAKLEEQKNILADKLEVFEAEQKEIIIFRRGTDTRIDLLKQENSNKNLIIGGIRGENEILHKQIKELEKELQAKEERINKLEQIARRFDQRTEQIERKAEREKEKFKTEIRELQQQKFRTEIRELPWNQKS